MTDTLSNGQLASAITTAVIRLHTECYGKGPTQAKTYLADDTVLVVLRDGYTRFEKNLQAAGRALQVQEQRVAYQREVAGRFRAVVERETGRRVRAYMSQAAMDPDVTIEFFLLDEPVG